MAKAFGKFKHKLIYKFTLFFVLGIFLPLTVISVYNLASTNYRNNTETEKYAYNTLLDFQRSFREELYSYDNTLDDVFKNYYVTDYPEFASNPTLKDEAGEFLAGILSGNNAIFDELKVFYYDFEGEGDSSFRSAREISEEKWYIDFFSENSYSDWHMDTVKRQMFRISRVFRENKEIGVGIATVDLERVLKTFNYGLDESVTIFAYETYNTNSFFCIDSALQEEMIKRLERADFLKLSAFDTGFKFSIKNGQVLSVYNMHQFGITLGCSFEVEQRELTKSSIVSIAIFSLFLISVAVFYVFIYRIFKSLNADIMRVEELIETDSSERLIVKRNDEIGMIERQFNRMLDLFDNLKTKIVLKEKSQKNAEIIALQNQTNPHFIYNTLNTFRMKLMLKGDNETSEEIAKFGKLLRYNMITRDHITTIENEMIYLKYYLDLQNDRFREKIIYDYEIPVGYNNVCIPKFIFQPMAENALKYGKKAGANLKFTISFDILEDNHILISFIDNGKGCDQNTVRSLNAQFSDGQYIYKAETENSSRIGLKNINQRLRLIYGEEYFLNVSSEENKYFAITFRIPVKYNEE